MYVGVLTVVVVIVAFGKLVATDKIVFSGEITPEIIKRRTISKFGVEVATYDDFVVRMVSKNFL